MHSGLAAAGALAVPLLGRSPEMRAVEARASIRALGMIATEEAMDQLAQFGMDQRLTVARELMRQWSQFDPNDYARRVMSESLLDGGKLEVGGDVPVSVVKYLEYLNELIISGELTDRDWADISSLNVTAIRFANTAQIDTLVQIGSFLSLEELCAAGQRRLASLANLARFESLVRLSLPNCGSLRELVPSGESWPESLTRVSIDGVSGLDVKGIQLSRISRLDLGARTLLTLRNYPSSTHCRR
jgi:hypothetical protein